MSNAVRVSQRHIKEFRELWFSHKWGCAVCGKPFTTKDNAVVDHDHTTGIIRGCLHNTCNRVEGELRGFAKRLAKGETPEQFMINLGVAVSKGAAAGRNVARITKWCHSGVSITGYLAGLANYLYYHQTPRTRMIHPNHRFPTEGGNNDKKHTKASLARRNFKRRKQ